MRKKTITGAFLCIAAALTVFSSCSESKSVQEHKKDVFAMDTYMSLKVYGENGKEALDAAEKEIQRLEGLFSVTDGKSDVSRINLQGSAQVSEDTAELITAALGYCKETDGALDITVYPLLKEWGFTAGEYHIPDDAVIDGLLSSVGYDGVTVSDSTVTVRKGGAVDLGAIAKGYTGDRISSLLRERGIASALLNLGGNVQAVGKKPDGSLWRVGIEHPRDAGRVVCTLSVEDKAVVTSGDYERYFIGEDGRRYCHIIDPETGRPADSGLISVTVIGASGVECDALSTALFVMGRERAESFLQAHGNIDAVLIDRDMKIYMTEGAVACAEMSGEYENTVIKRQ